MDQGTDTFPDGVTNMGGTVYLSGMATPGWYVFDAWNGSDAPVSSVAVTVVRIPPEVASVTYDNIKISYYDNTNYGANVVRGALTNITFTANPTDIGDTLDQLTWSLFLNGGEVTGDSLYTPYIPTNPSEVTLTLPYTAAIGRYYTKCYNGPNGTPKSSTEVQIIPSVVGATVTGTHTNPAMIIADDDTISIAPEISPSGSPADELHWGVYNEDGTTLLASTEWGVPSWADYRDGQLTFNSDMIDALGAGKYYVKMWNGYSADDPYNDNRTFTQVCSEYIFLLPVKVKEVSYGATDAKKHCNIKSDDGQTLYQGPHWQDNSSPRDGDACDDGDKDYPVAFVRGGTIKVSVSLISHVNLSQMSIQIKGKGPQGYEFPATAASMISTGDETTMSVSDVKCSVPLKNEIDIFEPFEVTWSISFDGGNSWSGVGKTATKVYVTLESPLTNKIDPYYTMLRIGCLFGKGATAKEAALDKIWTGLANLDIHKLSIDKPNEESLLTYWKDWDALLLGVGDKAEYLIDKGDAQCGGWADLLPKTIWCQGFTFGDVQRVELRGAGFDNYLFVANWTFSQTPFGTDDYPYWNWAGSKASIFQNSQHHWIHADMNEEDGVLGQGNKNPLSLFNGHVIAQANGKYYDVSYGNSAVADPVSGILDIQANIVGLGIGQQTTVNEVVSGIDYNGDGKLEENVSIYLIRIRKPRLNYVEVIDIPNPYTGIND